MKRGSVASTGLAVLVCFVLGACGGKDQGAAMDSTAMTDAAPSAAAAPAADAGSMLTDANIAALLDEANAADSLLAAAALPSLTSADAQTFAKLMMGEHHGLRVDGAKVFADAGISLQLPVPDPFKPAVEGEQNALASMTKGAAYDSTYIAHEVGIHQAVIDWAGTVAPQNPALQEYMKNAGPVLQKHLDMALETQRKLAGAR